MTSDWTSISCDACGWKVDHNTTSSMERIIQSYGEVARSVNKREFKRFAEEIRQNWNPVPPEENFRDEGYRGEGWTDEGAFAMCVFELAMGPSASIQPKRQGPLYEAEEMNQVLFRTMVSLLVDIRYGPLFDPEREEKTSEALAMLQLGLQRQADETVPSEPVSVKVPKDFEEVLRVTDGISGAVIPSETANTYLVGGLKGIHVDQGKAGEQSHANIFWRDHWTPFAAWKLGGCDQHRQIHYVLCRDAQNDVAPIAWRVIDRNDVAVNAYGSLAEFLEHETLHIETTLGGHKQEHILDSDRYPTYQWWQMNGGSWQAGDSSD